MSLFIKNTMDKIFNNTEVAFALKSDTELERASFLFKLIASQPLVKIGTAVTFKPDPQIFKGEIDFVYETLASRMRELSFLNRGLRIKIEDERIVEEDGSFHGEEFYSEEGLKEYIRFLDKNREPIISDIISMEGEENDIPVEVAMVYNTTFNENLFSYVNNINTHEGGTHLTGFRRGLTTTLKKYAEDSGMLSDAGQTVFLCKPGRKGNGWFGVCRPVPQD